MMFSTSKKAVQLGNIVNKVVNTVTTLASFSTMSARLSSCSAALMKCGPMTAPTNWLVAASRQSGRKAWMTSILLTALPTAAVNDNTSVVSASLLCYTINTERVFVYAFVHMHDCVHTLSF